MAGPRVAFQGEYGAFSEQAARGHFSRIHPVPAKTFPDVFAAVKSGRASYGIVPIENSLYGSIHQNYDLLKKFDLHISGEIILRVVHALLVNPGVSLKMVRTVYSHPQALGQCETFLARMKNVDIVAFYDTAGAAKMIRDTGRTDAAAIASMEAARFYRLKTLRTRIESDHRNFTRFLILSPRQTIARRHAKTSVIFSLKNVPGSLTKALSIFTLRDINLFKIESRPLAGKPWEYLFYLDFDGSLREEACIHAVDHLREITTFLKILGSYPRGKTLAS